MVVDWLRFTPREVERAQAAGSCIVCGQPLSVAPESTEAQSAVGECFLCAKHGREHLLEWASVSRHDLFSVW